MCARQQKTRVKTMKCEIKLFYMSWHSNSYNYFLTNLKYLLSTNSLALHSSCPTRAVYSPASSGDMLCSISL